MAVLSSQIGIKSLFFYLRIRLTGGGASPWQPGKPQAPWRPIGASVGLNEQRERDDEQQVDWCVGCTTYVHPWSDVQLWELSKVRLIPPEGPHCGLVKRFPLWGPLGITAFLCACVCVQNLTRPSVPRVTVVVFHSSSSSINGFPWAPPVTFKIFFLLGVKFMQTSQDDC